MECSRNNWQDVNKYYNGTYVSIPEYNSKKVLYIEKVTGDYIQFRDGADKSTGGLSFDDVPKYYLNFNLPHKQFFQGGANAYLIERIPARMWRKGISPENTVIRILSTNGTFVKRELTSDILNTFLENQYKTDDFGTFTEGSRALTPRLAVASNGDIFLDLYTIGRLNRKKEQVLVMSAFKQHLLPLIPKNFKVFYVA